MFIRDLSGSESGKSQLKVQKVLKISRSSHGHTFILSVRGHPVRLPVPPPF